MAGACRRSGREGMGERRGRRGTRVWGCEDGKGSGEGGGIGAGEGRGWKRDGQWDGHVKAKMGGLNAGERQRGGRRRGSRRLGRRRGGMCGYTAQRCGGGTGQARGRGRRRCASRIGWAGWDRERDERAKIDSGGGTAGRTGQIWRWQPGTKSHPRRDADSHLRRTAQGMLLHEGKVKLQWESMWTSASGALGLEQERRDQEETRIDDGAPHLSSCNFTGNGVGCRCGQMACWAPQRGQDEMRRRGSGEAGTGVAARIRARRQGQGSPKAAGVGWDRTGGAWSESTAAAWGPDGTCARRVEAAARRDGMGVAARIRAGGHRRAKRAQLLEHEAEESAGGRAMWKLGGAWQRWWA
ncbi:hypothetical protein B0H14DRAFT_2646966 [Mycena olivaceomarginata]|nr:hypothetical protein B0H14DRAFT_2646966 [Mycena olivaceomarginata]